MTVNSRNKIYTTESVCLMIDDEEAKTCFPWFIETMTFRSRNWQVRVGFVNSRVPILTEGLRPLPLHIFGLGGLCQGKGVQQEITSASDRNLTDEIIIKFVKTCLTADATCKPSIHLTVSFALFLFLCKTTLLDVYDFISRELDSF